MVSHWASIRLPSCSRFRQPPCDPEHRDFPDSVLTLAFPLQAFPTTTKLKCWHTCTPPSLVYLADWSLWWLIPVSQLTDLEPPSAQSPFAPCRRYLDGEDVLRLLERHYPSFIAHTDSCAKPLPSLRFQVTPLFERSLQVAASPRCVKARPNAISVVLPCVPGPLLQLLPRCCLPFLPLGHWPSPSEHGSALGFFPSLLLRMVKILELQSFLYVPAHRFVRLTGSSYPHTSQCRAAETFTATHITVGYLPRAAAMLTIQTGQLMGRGLAPLRYDSLVGYSVRIHPCHSWFAHSLAS